MDMAALIGRAWLNALPAHGGGCRYERCQEHSGEAAEAKGHSRSETMVLR
jgi:hypothetical protein